MNTILITVLHFIATASTVSAGLPEPSSCMGDYDSIAKCVKTNMKAAGVDIAAVMNACSDQ